MSESGSGAGAYVSVRRVLKVLVVGIVAATIPGSWRRGVVGVTKPAAQWLWATRPRRVVTRLVAGWHLIGAMLVLVSAPAHADTSTGVPGSVVFQWMDVKDSHGISVWKYFMSIDEGSAANPSHSVYSILISIEYDLYRTYTAVAIWFMGWALSFEWLQVLIGPVRTLGEALTSMTDQMNLTSTFLVVTAAIIGLWVLKGRYTTGLYELMVSCAIAALAVGVLSNPVERIAGPDGMIMQTRDAALQLGAGLANAGDTDSDPDKLVTSLKGEMADTFIRQPTQLMNFGRVIDTEPGGAKCVEAWDAGHEDAPGNDKDTLKDNIAGCGGEAAKQMKDYADHPGPGQIVAGLVLIPGGFIVLIFGVLIAGALIAAVGSALVSALKMIPGLVVGILPGVGRGSLLKSVATVLMSLVIVVFAIVFLVGYLVVIRSFFDGNGDHLTKKFLFVDIMLVIGIVMFRRGVKQLRKVSESLAAKMATRPGASPTAIPRSTTSASPLQKTAYGMQVGKQAWSGGKAIGQKAFNGASTATKAATPVGATAAVAGRVAKKRREAKAKAKEQEKWSKGTDYSDAPKTPAEAVNSSAIAKKVEELGGTAAGTIGKNSSKPAPKPPQPSSKPAPKSSTKASSPTGVLRNNNGVAKPGIKKPVISAPVQNSATSARGQVRASRQSVQSGPDGLKYRAFDTSGGKSILLPVKQHSTSSSVRSQRPSEPLPASHVPKSKPARPAPAEINSNRRR